MKRWFTKITKNLKLFILNVRCKGSYKKMFVDRPDPIEPGDEIFFQATPTTVSEKLKLDCIYVGAPTWKEFFRKPTFYCQCTDRLGNTIRVPAAAVKKWVPGHDLSYIEFAIAESRMIESGVYPLYVKYKCRALDDKKYNFHVDGLLREYSCLPGKREDGLKWKRV